jgi:hypothetical protein
MFWFKRKQIIVDCFTQESTTHLCYPPAPANEYFPEGWKKMPKLVKNVMFNDKVSTSSLSVDMPTLKKCTGFINLYTSGFIIPSWTDFGIQIDTKGEYFYYNCGPLRIDQHPSFQLWEGLYDGYAHIKLGSPWLFKEKTGVKFSWHQSDWHRTDIMDRCRIVSGVVDYKYQNQTNVNMFIKKDSVVEFKAGDPLVHLIPLSDKEVILKTHLINPLEFSMMEQKPSQYINQYKRYKTSIDKLEQAKCPFGFGK